MDKLTVIILSYNTKELTLKCLEHLEKGISELHSPVNTLVVENGTDGTGNLIKKNFKWVKLIEPKTNTGFAKGNNLGIKAASQDTEYYLFLNSDALIKPDTLVKSMNFMKRSPTCGAVGCKLFLGNGQLQPSAGYLPNPLNILFWMWGLDQISPSPVHPKNTNFFRGQRKVGWVMGAFLLVKKQVVEETGGFDEHLFMYMEEVEWCKRISDAGYEVWYFPEAEVVHLDKASSRGDNSQGIIKEVEGLLYFINKYYPSHRFWLREVIRSGLWLRQSGYRILGNRQMSLIYEKALQNI